MRTETKDELRQVVGFEDVIAYSLLKLVKIFEYYKYYR